MTTANIRKMDRAKFEVPLAETATEMHTWFERDRAHVELRSKLDDQTIVEWWDEAVGEAIEDGFLSRFDYHHSAYQYAKEMNLLPMVPRHFISGSGEHGCLYDNGPTFHPSYQEAISHLRETFDLGRTRTAQLKADGYLELNPGKDGAAYCEITTCDCGNPLDHQE